MYKAIRKIKDLELNKIWFIIMSLFILTITASIFFAIQVKKENLSAEERQANQIQVLPEEKTEDKNREETNQIIEASVPKIPMIKEEAAENLPIKEEVFEAPSIPQPEDLVMKWPGYGELITAYGFGQSETFNDIRFHAGIDIALPPGYEVRAALPGQVTSIFTSPLWGYEVIIKHGEKLETRYKGIKPVKEEGGYVVAKGDIIGQVTNSPPYEAKMNPHLHFEVYESGKSVDPMKYLQIP